MNHPPFARLGRLAALLLGCAPLLSLANPFATPSPEAQSAKTLQALELRLQAIEERSKKWPDKADLPTPLIDPEAKQIGKGVTSLAPTGKDGAVVEAPPPPVELGTLNGSKILLEKGWIYTSEGKP